MSGLRLELFVVDLERSVAFYRDALGFVPDAELPGAGPRGYVSVRRGEAVLGLGDASLLPTDHPVARSPDAPVGSGVEIVIEVDDLESLGRQLAAAGVTLVSPLAEQPWGLRDLRLLDPDGYYLRITERPAAHG